MTPGLTLGYDRQTEITEGLAMGGKVKDYGIGHDHSEGIHGVRLHVSQGEPAVHLPSPRLTRREVRVLGWMARGWAAIPDRLEPWWWSLSELDREGVERVLAGLSWLSWLALWWAAGGAVEEDGDQPSPPAPDPYHPDVRS